MNRSRLRIAALHPPGLAAAFKQTVVAGHDTDRRLHAIGGERTDVVAARLEMMHNAGRAQRRECAHQAAASAQTIKCRALADHYNNKSRSRNSTISLLPSSPALVR